ncbi:hypothetical protein THAOC_13143 [Thalassiosira oceanica]|uniref:Uncharacterized protein n=1 Tax=Thalassiosira oceanica TaxID=159749 RepID=K0SKU7_THAOC|nr:hypothetical protein THAOC_13143 [Thalassiosira oceanica]|eukprot:EJK65955.1 hypothetical protein THAOC_13143 [Thalassiosira oceanica]
MIVETRAPVSPTAAPQTDDADEEFAEFISPRVLMKSKSSISKELVSARRQRIEEKLLETRPSTSRHSILSLRTTGSSSPTPAETLSPGSAALARARENIEGRRKSRESAKAKVCIALASLKGKHKIPPPSPEGRSESDEITANEFIEEGRVEAELNETAAEGAIEQRRVETDVMGDDYTKIDDEDETHLDENRDLNDIETKSNEKSVGTLSGMFDHPEEAPVWTPEAKEAYSAVFNAKSELSATMTNTFSTSSRDDDSAPNASMEEVNATRLAQLHMLGESQVWDSIQSAGWRKRQRMIHLSEWKTRLSDMSQISSLQFVSIQRRAAIIAIIGGLFLSIWAYLTPDFVSATNGWIYGLRGPFARTFSALSIVCGAFTLEILRRNLQHREHIETLWTLAIWSAYFASLCQVSAVFAVFASRTCAHGCFMVSLGVIANELSL